MFQALNIYQSGGFMRALILLIPVILALQGCATDGSNSASVGTNREVIASPAARISAGSGAMHTGMSGPAL